MTGFILSLTTAVLTTSKDWAVKNVSQKHSRQITTWAYFVFAAPLLMLTFLVAAWYYQALPNCKVQFFIALLIDVPLILLANYCYVIALQRSEMSLCIPLLAFTPIGIIPIAAVFLNEKPTLLGWCGVCLIVLGSFALNIKKAKKGFWGPIQAIARDKGAPFMLGTALIWSITSVIDKLGIKGCIAPAYMQALTWASAKTFLAAILITVILLLRNHKNVMVQATARPGLQIAGLFYGLEQFVQMWAVSLWDVAYVNAVKRVSILLSTIVGLTVWKEKDGAERIIAAIIMIIGIGLIIVYG